MKTSASWEQKARGVLDSIPPEERARKREMLDMIAEAVKPLVPEGTSVVSYHRYPTNHPNAPNILESTQQFLILVPRLSTAMRDRVFDAIEDLERQTTIGIRVFVQDKRNRMFDQHVAGPDTSLVQDAEVNL